MTAYPINFYEKETAVYIFFALITTTIWGSAWHDLPFSSQNYTSKSEYTPNYYAGRSQNFILLWERQKVFFTVKTGGTATVCGYYA